ncbi:PhoH family protein [bacterium]|nr:PhoH family protein [bacterium]
MKKEIVPLQNVELVKLFGAHDEFLLIIEEAFPDARIVARGDKVSIQAGPEDIAALKRVFKEMIYLASRNQAIDRNDVLTVLNIAGQEGVDAPEESGMENIPVIFYGKKGVIRPKTSGQRIYFSAMLNNDIVFAEGPAGTGKTYLAVATALQKLKNQEIARIILCRPAIEAGESLGYLPGDLMDKVDPYLRPLTDALFDMLSSEKINKYLDQKIIEIIPLAYMRGRTLNNAFVILDEAQNTSPMQMKMFLTRLAANSQAVVTGDTTQIDLPVKTVSGLVQIQEILQGIEGIKFVSLKKEDVVRHRLVKEIIKAYEDYNGQNKGEEPSS